MKKQDNIAEFLIVDHSSQPQNTDKFDKTDSKIDISNNESRLPQNSEIGVEYNTKNDDNFEIKILESGPRETPVERTDPFQPKTTSKNQLVSRSPKYEKDEHSSAIVEIKRGRLDELKSIRKKYRIRRPSTSLLSKTYTPHGSQHRRIFSEQNFSKEVSKITSVSNA